MANSADLVTLGRVKAWLTINAPVTAAADAILVPWITSASRKVVNYLNRDSTLGYRQITSILDGNGQNFLLLPQWPVLGVSAVSVGGSSYSPQADFPFGSGYSFDAWTGDDTQGNQRLFLNGGHYFPRIPRNISVTYTAGYQVQQEPHTIPAATPYTISTDRGYYSDQGVVKASDLSAFARVTGTPGVGQYNINDDNEYVFNAADASTDVLITYSYTPEDLQQAVIDTIAYWYRNRDRIGITSRAIGGQENVSYLTDALPAFTLDTLAPFRNVIPL